MVIKLFLKNFIIVSALCLLSACQKSGGGSESESSPATNNSSSNSSNSANPLSGEVTTDCGVVFDGKLQNPVNLNDGEFVRVTDVLGSNLVVVETTDSKGVVGQQLVKLQGVASGPSSRQDAAMNMLQNLSYNNTTFFRASKDCAITLSGGGSGTIGQILTSNGESFGESLLKAGLADVDTNDSCGGDKIASCLSALKGSEVTPVGEIQDFLWKPVSDTKGPILVIHELHCNATVLVNGVELEYRGGGNGRCGTYAGTKSGCAYGANIKVEVLDKSTGAPYTHQGSPYVIIPNGCNRVEIP